MVSDVPPFVRSFIKELGFDGTVSRDTFYARFGKCFWDALIASKTAGAVVAAPGGAVTGSADALPLTRSVTDAVARAAADASVLGAALRAAAVHYGQEDEAMLLDTNVVGVALSVVTAGPASPVAVAAFHDAMSLLSCVLPPQLTRKAWEAGGAATQAVNALVATARSVLVRRTLDQFAADMSFPPVALRAEAVWLLPRGAPAVHAGQRHGFADVVAPHEAVSAARFALGLSIYVPTGGLRAAT